MPRRTRRIPPAQDIARRERRIYRIESRRVRTVHA